MEYNTDMAWIVEYTDEFGDWFSNVQETVQDDIDRTVGLLEALGHQLGFPHSSGISGSRHEHLRELRIQSGGVPYRIFYAFDPRRAAILLIGGNKSGHDRFYDIMIPIADKLYDIYLIELKKEGIIP